MVNRSLYGDLEYRRLNKDAFSIHPSTGRRIEGVRLENDIELTIREYKDKSVHVVRYSHQDELTKILTEREMCAVLDAIAQFKRETSEQPA